MKEDGISSDGSTSQKHPCSVFGAEAWKKSYGDRIDGRDKVAFRLWPPHKVSCLSLSCRCHKSQTWPEWVAGRGARRKRLTAQFPAALFCSLTTEGILVGMAENAKIKTCYGKRVVKREIMNKNKQSLRMIDFQ